MATPMLRTLLLKRFRSFPASQVCFDNPTFLVGKNGSGKSNLADTFALLAEAMASPLAAVFDRRGGIVAVGNRSSARGRPSYLGLRVDFECLNENTRQATYAFELRPLKGHGFEVVRERCDVGSRDGSWNWFDRIGTTFSSNARSLSPSLDASALALPLIGGDARFQPVLGFLSEMCVYRFDPFVLREMQDPDSGRRLRPDASNIASVLREIQNRSREDWGRLLGLLEKIVPATNDVKATPRGNKLSLQFSQDWGKTEPVRFEAYSMSDGTLRALALLAAVFQVSAPSLLVIEEPEATIHPGALGVVLDVLRQAGGVTQVLVTTHSPDILDGEWIEERHLRVVSWRRGVSHVAGVSESTREALRRHLMGAGELLRANALVAAELFEPNPGQRSLFQGPRG